MPQLLNIPSIQLIALCEGDDTVLSKLPCYKGVQSLLPLKISGLGEDITHLYYGYQFYNT